MTGLSNIFKYMLNNSKIQLFKAILQSVVWSTVVFGTVLGSTVLIADRGMSKMIELTTRHPYCQMHTNRGNIRNMLLAADPKRVRQMTDDAIAQLEEVCLSKQVVSAHQGGFIYPGTKWCGPGNVAKNYSDLGKHYKEDACCREHDGCPMFLMSGDCKEGICNNSPYTRSHCECDAAFRRCLQNVNTETANTIGAIFFNVVQVICFRERNPCSEWQKLEYADLMMESLLNVPVKERLDCIHEYRKSARYKPPESQTNEVLADDVNIVRVFKIWHQKKLTYVNKILRSFKFL